MAPTNEHEYDLSNEKPQAHRFDKQEGTRIYCSVPGHTESYIVRPTQILKKMEDGSLAIVDMEVA